MQRSASLVFAAAVAALSSVDARAADAPPSPVPPTITTPSKTPVQAAPATPSASPTRATPTAVVPPGELLEEAEPARPKGGEPAIRRTVIEDRAARIEELRVRGTLQKVTVAPKGGAPGYEVLTGGGYHATADDPGTSRGSAGKRVWNVLRF
ncbi:MAG TPA: hypothetical protein VGI48_04495 [Caldimonas sp.]|jgi:hypothetical protein